MKIKQEYAKSKVCPRCGLRVMGEIDTCPDCGLVFSRLALATNKDAKRKKLRHDRDFIIMTNKLPQDVSFIKLLLMCIFLGVFGGHNFYVGRYLKGSILLGDFLVLTMFVIFNNSLVAIDGGGLLGFFSTVCGIVMLMWFWDLLMIITKRYKVPVAIDLEGKEDYMQININEHKSNDEIDKVDNNSKTEGGK